MRPARRCRETRFSWAGTLLIVGIVTLVTVLVAICARARRTWATSLGRGRRARCDRRQLRSPDRRRSDGDRADLAARWPGPGTPRLAAGSEDRAVAARRARRRGRWSGGVRLHPRVVGRPAISRPGGTGTHRCGARGRLRGPDRHGRTATLTSVRISARVPTGGATTHRCGQRRPSPTVVVPAINPRALSWTAHRTARVPRMAGRRPAASSRNQPSGVVRCAGPPR